MKITISKNKGGGIKVLRTLGTTNEAVEICKEEFNRRGYDTGKFTMCENGTEIYLQRGALSIPDNINE